MRAGVEEPLRPGARRLHIYNEGLCVYAFDAGHEARLREMLASGQYGSTSAIQDFFENLNVPEFGQAVAREGLAIAFELQQDDEVELEVMVGARLKKAQLRDARWMAPQTSWLHLPTGRLRIETPNTNPLDPDPGDDPGGLVEVPPGHYQVRLYRVDWEAMHRDLDDESEQEEVD